MTIKDFQEKSYVAGANLEDIADTIQTYWKINYPLLVSHMHYLSFYL